MDLSGAVTKPAFGRDEPAASFEHLSRRPVGRPGNGRNFVFDGDFGGNALDSRGGRRLDHGFIKDRGQQTSVHGVLPALQMVRENHLGFDFPVAVFAEFDLEPHRVPLAANKAVLIVVEIVHAFFIHQKHVIEKQGQG